jgi:hypothetical protein
MTTPLPSAWMTRCMSRLYPNPLPGTAAGREGVWWCAGDGGHILAPVVHVPGIRHKRRTHRHPRRPLVVVTGQNLTDRQAAESVRCCLGWKYCLGLELDDPGFDHSVLSEFRDRMTDGARADRLVDVMVERLAAAELSRPAQDPSAHLLANPWQLTWTTPRSLSTF